MKNNKSNTIVQNPYYVSNERHLDPYSVASPTDPVISHDNSRYKAYYYDISDAEDNQSIDAVYDKYFSDSTDPDIKGAVVTNNGYVSFDSDYIPSNGIMFGAAVVNKSVVNEGEGLTLKPVAIVETKNQGLHYVDINPDNGAVEVLAPVSHVCFVGGNKRPSHIIVPLTEPQAIKDAKEIINHFDDMYNEIVAHDASNCATLPKAPFEDEGDDEYTNGRIRTLK